MKAIETRYKGYRFRSRLEARWAVFFDALGLRWEYEPEGFDLGFGDLYLPDFKVNGMWFEVKPEGASEVDMRKARTLCAQGGGAVCIAEGAPAARAYRYFEKDEPDAPHVREDALIFMPKGWKYYPWYYAWGSFDRTTPPEELAREFVSWVDGLGAAIAVARGARFEHGERPDR